MSAILAILIGVALWIPVFTLLAGIPAFGARSSEWEYLATFAPVLLVSVPAFARHLGQEKVAEALWVFARSPLLALAGAGGMFGLQAVFLTGLRPSIQAMICSLMICALSCLIAWLDHRASKVPPEA